MSAKPPVAAVASRQFARVSRAQLLAVGVSGSTVTSWSGNGFLYPELPRVYAVGSPARSVESDLFSAILYAGPYAGLRGLSGAVWRGLVRWREPEAIQVATPRRCRSLSAEDPTNRLGIAIEVKQRHRFERCIWKGMPTVPISQIALDIAATGDLLLTRIVLANMDYRRLLNEAELLAICGPGIKGSGVLTEALGNPQARFARVRSVMEIRFIVILEDTGSPLPDTNRYIGDIEVDAVWWEEMLVVQLDGKGNHGTDRQRERDAAIDRRLEGLGFKVIRYRWEQLGDPWAIHREIVAALRERRGWASLRGRAA